MNLKKKVATYTISGMVGLSLLAGGATYALFTDSAQNTNNSFAAGTLDITAKKDDVPNTGPMFYTKSPDKGVVLGGMPTGVWAPGDKHTRGLFLENEGSLKAVLKSLSISPTTSSAVEVTQGVDYDNGMLFARQAKVIVWNVKKIDLDGHEKAIKAVDADTMNTMMEWINYGYNLWRTANPNKSLEDQQAMAEAMNTVNSYLIDKLRDLPSNGKDVTERFQVKNLYEAQLSNMVNNNIELKAQNIQIDPGEAVLLGFTVELMKNPPAGSGIDQNALQGKSVYFTFKTNWEQKKNN